MVLAREMFSSEFWLPSASQKLACLRSPYLFGGVGNGGGGGGEALYFSNIAFSAPRLLTSIASRSIETSTLFWICIVETRLFEKKKKKKKKKV